VYWVLLYFVLWGRAGGGGAILFYFLFFIFRLYYRIQISAFRISLIRHWPFNIHH
jgi:hypothetical protein